MLPEVIIDIIDSYVLSMNDYGDLPSFPAVRRLMDHCDNWVMGQLGGILGMPSSEVNRLRFRLQTRGEFVFYFHLDQAQRLRMLTLLQHSVEGNRHISCMTWIYLERVPKLINIPRYRQLFKDGLFCRMMEYLVSV